MNIIIQPPSRHQLTRGKGLTTTTTTNTTTTTTTTTTTNRSSFVHSLQRVFCGWCFWRQVAVKCMRWFKMNYSFSCRDLATWYLQRAAYNEYYSNVLYTVRASRLEKLVWVARRQSSNLNDSSGRISFMWSEYVMEYWFFNCCRGMVCGSKSESERVPVRKGARWGSGVGWCIQYVCVRVCVCM